jgi:hypothetical protein
MPNGCSTSPYASHACTALSVAFVTGTLVLTLVADAGLSAARAADAAKPNVQFDLTYGDLAKRPQFRGLWVPKGGLMDKGAPQFDPFHSSIGTSLVEFRKNLPPLKPEYVVAPAPGAPSKVDPTSAGLCPPPSGLPGAMTTPYAMEIVQGLGETVALLETSPLPRRIFTDGRKHPGSDDLNPSYMGHSIGHWEGGTLVVDTVGFNDNRKGKKWQPEPGQREAPFPRSEQMHMTERMRLTDQNTFEDDMTIDDPETLTKPWVIDLAWSRSDSDPLEYVCEENNRGFTPDSK